MAWLKIDNKYLMDTFHNVIGLCAQTIVTKLYMLYNEHNWEGLCDHL